MRHYEIVVCMESKTAISAGCRLRRRSRKACELHRDRLLVEILEELLADLLADRLIRALSLRVHLNYC